MLALGFIALALVTAGSNTLAVDLAISKRVQLFDNPVARSLGWIGDHLGSTVAGLICLAIGFTAAALLRSARDAWFLGIAAVLRLLATFLKAVSDSPRPSADQVDQLRLYDSTGFPSGHATTATLLMGTLVFMVASRIDRPSMWLVLLAVGATGAVVTAFARIFHGAHWFTDTIGGTIVGLIILLVADNVSAAIVGLRSSGQRIAQPQTPGQ